MKNSGSWFRAVVAIASVPILLAMAPATTQPGEAEGSPASAPTSAPATGENLIANGGFEQPLDGWDTTKDYGMSLIAPEAAHSGNSGLRVSDSDGNKGSSLGSPRVPTEPGKMYEVKFWARIMSGKDAAVYIQFFDNKDKLLNKGSTKSENQIKLSGEEWKEYTGRATAPPKAATVRVWIHSGNAAKVIADFDDLSLTEVSQ